MLSFILYMAPFKRLTNKVMLNKGKELEGEEKEAARAETEREEEKEMVLERLERMLCNQMEEGWMAVHTKRCSPAKEWAGGEPSEGHSSFP